MSYAETEAARFTGVLWAAIHSVGGLEPPDRREYHFPGSFDREWLASLELPLDENRPPGQPVALLEDRDIEFERHTDNTSLRAAYDSWPRTQVAEDIAAGQDGKWYALAAHHLTRLSNTGPHVTCNIFVSRHGDETFMKHRDAWFNAAVQVSGMKRWQIGEALFGSAHQEAREITMNAGDILLVPKYVPHVVHTPERPGHSVHLAFAIDREPPDIVRAMAEENRKNR